MYKDSVLFRRVSYTAGIRKWLQETDHYLHNAPPGCLFAVGAYISMAEPIKGICVVGRPCARALDDGTTGEVTRLYLTPGLPHGTASAILRYAFDVGWQLGLTRIYSYHDRTRHTGCIYRKAGMRKDGVTEGRIRPGKRTGASVVTGATSKRRWIIERG